MAIFGPARVSRAIVFVLLATPVGVLLTLFRPRLIVPGAVLVSVGAGASVRLGGARREDSVVVATLAVPFAVNYLFGMWRGYFARLRVVRVRRLWSNAT